MTPAWAWFLVGYLAPFALLFFLGEAIRNGWFEKMMDAGGAPANTSDKVG